MCESVYSERNIISIYISVVETIDGWMSTACSIGNSQLLSVALLCARQCCATNNQVFGLYSTWFGSLQIRSASGFNFFMQFLSQLVPSEPALYLKIHVNKVCNSFYFL